MQHDLRTEIDIAASPATVWDILTTEAGGTHLVHSEKMTGVLVRFMRKSLDTKTLPGFEAMNDALKVRAETAAGSAS